MASESVHRDASLDDVTGGSLITVSWAGTGLILRC
jgi:hypothetical protein